VDNVILKTQATSTYHLGFLYEIWPISIPYSAAPQMGCVGAQIPTQATLIVLLEQIDQIKTLEW
jgi:hypothetical protein